MIPIVSGGREFHRDEIVAGNGLPQNRLVIAKPAKRALTIHLVSLVDPPSGISAMTI